MLAMGLGCYKWYVNENAGPQWGWIVRSHTGLREKRNILYKGVKPLPREANGDT